MQSSPSKSRRQSWLTAYRIGSTVLLVALLAIGIANLVRPSGTISVEQASKVQRAASFLQDAGFGDPVYLGIKPATEGEYPTFRAKAIGGESVDLMIRTTPNGGWELQVVGLFSPVESADALARAASKAVYDWENMPPSIQPRTDGAFGEYESRQHDYNLLFKYVVADDTYWQQPRDETAGWPRTQ
jgi:hypothetical protein